MIDISSYTAAKNVTIECSANGNPLPVINLLKDGDVIKTENNSHLTYKIDIVTERDGGSYKCTAKNGAGSKESETTILNYYVDYCVSNPCGNRGTCRPANFEFTCECQQGYSGRYCENSIYCTSLTIGMLFVGIIVGAFGVIGGLIGYTRIKRKAQIGKRSANQRQNLDKAQIGKRSANQRQNLD
ncbi:fibropellin-3-like, partial [Anneissia japonica]|uniref:fibropellin-3-like n=1 Tax=Anneissia japonica TaxID=1529436 RepID=UPI001425659A